MGADASISRFLFCRVVESKDATWTMHNLFRLEFASERFWLVFIFPIKADLMFTREIQ